MTRSILLCSLFLLVSSAWGQSGSDLRILSETATELTLEFTPAFIPRSAPDRQTHLSFVGAVSEESEDASFIVPVRRIPLVLPTGRCAVNIAHSTTELRTDLRPDLVTAETRRAGWVNRTTGPRQRLAEVTRLVPEGNHFTALLTIRPVQFPAAGSPTVYKRIILKITFDAVPAGHDPVSILMTGGRESFGSLHTQSLAKTSGSADLSTGMWYKLEVNATGIYALDLAYLQKAGLSAAAIGNIQSIRLFGNGGEVLPEALSAARPDGLVEISRQVVDRNGNGAFDADDLVLFYGTSTRGWRYDPAAKTFRHFIHPYTEKNFYFLTAGGSQTGKPMDSVASLAASSPYVAPDFLEKVAVEQERWNLINSGRRWLGAPFDLFDNTELYTTTLYGLVTGKPVVYRCVLTSRSSSVDTFRVYENDQLVIGPVPMYSVNVNDEQYSSYLYDSGVLEARANVSVPSERSALKFRFGSNNQSAKGWLDYFEILYRRRFEAVGDQLLFPSVDTTAAVRVEYDVTGFSSTDVYAFDVTAHNDVKRITGLTTPIGNGSTRTLVASGAAGSVRQFAFAGTKGFLRPVAVRTIQNSGLRAMTQPVDFIIISPVEFLSEAERLKSHRERRDTLRTLVVDVEQIYNEFSGGLQDVMAVRDFLKYTQDHWAGRRRYVLLFGNGHYDYKNISTTLRNYVPAYEMAESRIPVYSRLYSYATDDAFVQLNPADPAKVSMAVGRLPARSLQEARSTIDKILAYETSSPFDPWRNRITYVADDGWTPERDDLSLHTAQSDDLAQYYTPSGIDKKKIFIVEYPTVNTATGRRKPLANTAIVDAFNRGSVIVNYTGHGNTRLWAHEAIFTREESLPQLTNRDRLTFFVGATCNFGQYDNPNDQSAGEILIAMDQGGAIGEVTASRAVYADQNAALNQTFYFHLFNDYPAGPVLRLGDAMYLTKQTLFSDNDAKFHLLGDPTMRLIFPSASADIDSINGISTAQVVPIRSLGKAEIRGAVRSSNGSVRTSFNGTGVLEMYDSRRKQVVSEWSFVYYLTGSLLYRGGISVRNGRFSATVPVPKDVSFGDQSRVALYAVDTLAGGDVAGVTDRVSFAGSDSLAAPDTVGPRVELYIGDASFRSGDVVPTDATLIAELSDDNGINTSTVGIGHRLEAVLRNPAVTYDLSDYYRSKLDKYQEGSVTFRMKDLPEGRNTVRVRAWDTRNNASEAEIMFDVRADEGEGIVNAVNIPNPFSRSTVFTFQRVSTAPMEVELRVYTVGGRLVESKMFDAGSERLVQFTWDGTDRDGSELANGVYFYRLTARTLDGRWTADTTGKLAIVR